MEEEEEEDVRESVYDYWGVYLSIEEIRDQEQEKITSEGTVGMGEGIENWLITVDWLRYVQDSPSWSSHSLPLSTQSGRDETARIEGKTAERSMHSDHWRYVRVGEGGVRYGMEVQ